jgi:hypothetical protein
MKKSVSILVLSAIIFTLISCKKESTDIITTPACSVNVTSFTALQQNDDLNFTINTNTATDGYVYKFQLSGSSAAPFILQTNSKKINLKSAGVPVTGGNYLISVKTSCQGGEGIWAAPVSTTITPYVSNPYDLSYANAATGFDWKQDVTPTIMQVQYAAQGFILGNGIIETVTTKPYKTAKINANFSYDFYVRIGNGNGVWSKWVGPLTYNSTTTQNICNMPFSFNYSYQYTTPGEYNGVIIDFNRNGETNFEHALVPAGTVIANAAIKSLQITNPTGPGAGIYYDIQKGVSYKLYIRTVCTNGDKTEWNYISF